MSTEATRPAFRLLVLLSMILAAPLVVLADEPAPSTEEVAAEYFRLYRAQDFDALAPFLDDQSVYEDPTASRPGQVYRAQGTKAILDKMREAYAAALDPQYEVETSFVSGEHAVYVGTFSYGAPGATLGLKAESARLSSTAVLVLHIVAGKVVHHTELADYATVFEQVQALQAKEARTE